MTHRYHIDSITVKAIATMMGCAPDHGLVNRLNSLRERGTIGDNETYGSILRAVVEDLREYSAMYGRKVYPGDNTQ